MWSLVAHDKYLCKQTQNPKTDQAKRSIPGQVGVKRVHGVPTVFPVEEVAADENLLVTVYDHGPVQVCLFVSVCVCVCFYCPSIYMCPDPTHLTITLQAVANDITFDVLRARVDEQWRQLPKSANVYSGSLEAKMHAVANGTYQNST